MRYVILFLLVALAAAAFNSRKCEHVFTEVEQACVKIERPSMFGGMYVDTWPSGLQEGKELICVKCFHVQKQVLDYGGNQQHGLFLIDAGGMNITPLELFKIDSTGMIVRDSSGHRTLEYKRS